jgi:hypothetical protein
MTPPPTATAGSAGTVTTVTNRITKAPDLGTRRRIRSEFYAKVPITTMNILSTRAASGISSITGVATRTKSN